MTGLRPVLELAAAAGGLGAVVAAPLVYAMLKPRSGFYGPVIWKGSCPPGTPAGYALTFDDGPTPQSTAQILDILRDLGAPATFFVIGGSARRHPQLVQRMHEEGHLVANHSHDHSHYCMLRAGRYWQDQLRQTDDVIERIIGRRPALFRPPMGVKTWFITGALQRSGHVLVTWSRRAFDGVRTTPQRILDRLLPATQAGDIVMLHDGVEPHSRRDPRPTIEALPRLIGGLRQRGLVPLPLDRLIGRDAYVRSSDDTSAGPASPASPAPGA